MAKAPPRRPASKPTAKEKVKKEKPSYAKIARPKVKEIKLPGPDEFHEPSTNFTDYTTLIYGAKGIGKTTGTSTFPDNLSISFEPKRRNVKHRRYAIEFKKAAEITGDDDDPWCELVEVCRLAIADPTIKSLTIDTVDIAYEICQEHICRKRGIENPSEKSDGGNAWNDLKATFTALFGTLIEEGMTVIFVSHAKERDQEFMENIEGMSIIGPSCSPACLKILKQICDFWFFYGYHEGKRTLTIRDPNRYVDVAVGIGFEEADGTPIEKIVLPDDPTQFFNAINEAFKPKTAAPKKKAVRKLPPRK